MSKITDDEKLLANLKQQVEDLQRKIAEEKRQEIRSALIEARTSRSVYFVKKLLKLIVGMFPNDDVFRGSTADLLNELVNEGLEVVFKFVEKNKTVPNGERYLDRFTFGPLSEHLSPEAGSVHLSKFENNEREVQETQLIPEVNHQDEKQLSQEWDAGVKSISTLLKGPSFSMHASFPTTTTTTTSHLQQKSKKKRLLEDDPIDEDDDLEQQLLQQLPVKKKTVSNHYDKVQEQFKEQPIQQAQEIIYSWEETQPC